jgi:hypothetical protein
LAQKLLTAFIDQGVAMLERAREKAMESRMEFVFQSWWRR